MGVENLGEIVQIMQQIPEKESGKFYALGVCLHRQRCAQNDPHRALSDVANLWLNGDHTKSSNSPSAEERNQQTKEVEPIQKEYPTQAIHCR